MRPVNLIPPDERSGDSASLRTGKLIYVLVGGLALLLLGIAAVALTSKQISDRESQKASLQQELNQVTAQANSLAAFSNFRAVQEQRAATVASLAQSRFDWSRVLHELSLVLPSGVSITNLSGSASPDSTSSGGSGGSGGGDLRSGIQGPALEISGCAPGQDAVAGFVSALQEIDGVTRVGLSSSQSADAASSGGASSSTASSSSSGSGSTDCNAGPDSTDFNITVAFDAVPTPSTATAAPSVPSSVSSGSGSDASQLADAQSQEAVARNSARTQISKGQKATKLIPGG
jgi:Tfp pilus assembly protein PilN